MGDLKKARAALTRHQVDMRKMYAEKRIIMNINIDKLHCLIDLHVHLDGSVSIPMAKRLALINGIELNESEEDLKERLQVSKDCRDLNEYLEKFEFPLTLLQKAEALLKASGISGGAASGNDNVKSGFVTFIGRPNVGKSTLMNNIIGQKIAITSNKPQTTRNRIQTVYTDERGQIVFVDTPGIHKAKNKLGEYMVGAAEKTINEVDVVCFIVEPTTYIGAGEQHIIEKLKKVNAPKILVINKVDTVKKEEILPVIDCYNKELEFDEIIPVSARNGSNVDDLVTTIFKYLTYGPMFYDEDTVTDQPLRQIVAELIREKALHALNEEIPHGIAVVIDTFKDRKSSKGKITDIDATIICERDSHKGIIIGKGGEMLKKIGTNARYEIEKQLGNKVNLKLWVKVKKEWRDSDILIKNFGYDKKDNKTQN